jgi:hypothetical protein
MLLIGTINITRTRDRGDFHCPTCGGSREYLLKSRRPFLTLYFIPTVPIGGVEYFVRCSGCGANWDPAILRMDAATLQEQRAINFGIEAFRAAVLTALASGVISENQIQALLRISARLLPAPIDREQLGQLCSSAYQNRITAANYVRSVSGAWTTEQRQFALQAMFVAASANGETLDDATLRLLASLRDLLRLTDREYQDAVEAAIDWDVG